MTDASRTYAIHPAIGIARMGDTAFDPANPATFYLGAEAPYEVPNRGRAYKIGGRIRKQAQRFRIFEFENGVAVREITLAAADVSAIEWVVHLANRKAALNPDLAGCPVSTPGVPPESFDPARARNITVGAGHAAHGADDPRRSLVIDPGPQTVRAGRDGADAARTLAGAIGFPCDSGMARADVTLGTIATERDTGRLLVFAGDGVSRGLDGGAFTDSAPFGSAPDRNDATYANSDSWYDDSADGRVQARVTFSDGRAVALDRPEQAAWVICTMPRFAPWIGCFTTLHDLALDAVSSQADLDRRASFMRDIYPILASASQLHWVNNTAALGHGVGKPGDYSGRMALLADNEAAVSSAAYQRREAVFARIRAPHATDRDPKLMPRVSKDVWGSADSGAAFDIAAFTSLQYAMLKKWRDGDFDNDFNGSDPYTPLGDMDVADRPAALDRGALDGTAGTPLYPGIESWKIMRTPGIYAAPLRLSDAMRPGDLTMGNALPWQADFLDCTDTWWPVQRPTYVRRNGGAAAGPWAPAAWRENDDVPLYAEMVKHWSELGFIVAKGSGLIEDERSLEG
jgi:hypothetical protein